MIIWISTQSIRFEGEARVRRVSSFLIFSRNFASADSTRVRGRGDLQHALRCLDLDSRVRKRTPCACVVCDDTGVVTSARASASSRCESRTVGCNQCNSLDQH